jgi:Sec-independent protein translocase protein TatA
MLMITIFLFEIGLILFGIAGRILLLISRASLKIKKLKKQMEPLEKTRSQIRTKQDENEKKIKQEYRQIEIIKNRSFLSTQRSRAKEQQPT